MTRFVLGLVVMALCVVLYSALYFLYWGWFVEPIFHLGLGKWQVYGLVSMVGMTHSHFDGEADTLVAQEKMTGDEKMQHAVGIVIQALLVRPIFLLLVGYFVHRMITG